MREPDRSEMESHLSGGCEACMRLITLLRSVVETARDDIEVPDPVLASAAAIFVPHQARGDSQWRRLVAALTFDSQAALAPEGVRSVLGGARRLAFSVEDFAVELLIDVSGPQRTVGITGQVSMERKRMEASPVSIAVISGREVFQRALTNESGEFHLEFPSRARLCLCLRDETGRREIEIPLESVVGLRRVARKKTKLSPDIKEMR